MNDIRPTGTPRIWAHRGASRRAPENTLAAFSLAVELGADGVELDVQRSADGVLVVCHDETVDRTSDGTGAIADLTFAQLRALRFDNGFEGFADARIPTLREVLDLLGPSGLVVNIELKNSVVRYEGMEALVLDEVRAAGFEDRIVFSSFNHRSLVTLRELGTSAPLGVLYVEPLVAPWAYAASFGAAALHPYGGSIWDDDIARAHEAGVRVHAWTVDDPEQVRGLAAQGIDAIITNVPDEARAALG
ncbi:glycerophosphodiester phosphodiesterase [Brooklawnia cerclae]|uniref:Glycerophosphoryl diester phosphodiesterase n=1 Tax=Brooklawnia cerclae TaxID=349934 RepID=A0ABX0SBI5_9ACTN|nr:glycerophosphoryl diester phosphodiesterase [Brooklawnia cerclae]